jgi:hypothetical protein
MSKIEEEIRVKEETKVNDKVLNDSEKSEAERKAKENSA